MRVVDFKGRSNRIKLDRIEILSDKLAADIARSCERFIKFPDDRPINLVTLYTRLTLLLPTFSNIVELLAEPYRVTPQNR